jgi:quercetin dioxygenase-like cupin family protein
MTTAAIEYPGYEAACPWHHRQPFADGEQHPTVITRAEAPYSSWAPVPGNSTPSWIYVGTKRVNCGTFYVQPGGWFDPGNHPNPEPYYILKGTLHLSNPDTSDVIEIRAGEASNIPAFAYHHAWNFGDETCEILWWVPREMHTDEFKAKMDRDSSNPQWYERAPVMLNGPNQRNDGFPSHLDDLTKWPSEVPTKGPADMQHLPPSTWLHLLQGTDPRLTVLNSFFYCDEHIRCSLVSLPRGRESQAESGDYERLLYVEKGALSVNLTGTGKSLLAHPDDLVFLPPFTEHSLQAIGDEPVRVLSALAFE